MSHLEPDLDDEEIDDADLGPTDDDAPLSGPERARVMGWKPFDEYRGDPRKWTDWQEFIRKGEEELPVMRDNNRRMVDRLARTDVELTTLRETVASQKTAIDSAIALAKRADERGYQRGLQELKDRQKEAFRAGDEDAFDAVQEQIDAAEAARAADVAPPPPAPPPPPVDAARPALDPAISAFVAKHKEWFSDASRPYLQTAMIGMHNAEIAEDPSVPVAEQLERAYDRMVAAYPEIAPAGDEHLADDPPPPRREARRQPSVLPPSRGVAPRRPGAGSPIDKIADPTERADVRRAFESIKRHDPGMTEAEYMTIYNDPRADAVALVNARKK